MGGDKGHSYDEYPRQSIPQLPKISNKSHQGRFWMIYAQALIDIVDAMLSFFLRVEGNPMKRLAFLTLAVISAMPGASLAYDRDIHYTVTAMILADLDRTNSPMVEKKLLAAIANQYTDYNSNTLPSLNPTQAQQRRNWHFPAKMDDGLLVNTYGVTKRNSEFAKHNVNKGLEANDPYALGMSLHTYLDSFSHEGYEAYFGHAVDGHNPDRVHLDVDKFREAVWMT